MNKKTGTVITLLLSASLLLGASHEAEAKRMGGGSSFGSRPSYSAPYQRSTTPMQPSSQPARSASQQQAATQNQAARQNWASRGGFMGLLGGLALGGLLGSLFFGGAFEGINFFDILLIVGVGYLLLKLFAARAPQSQPQPLGNAYQRGTHGDSNNAYGEPMHSTQSSSSGFDTDILFKNAKQTGTGVNQTLPAGFDKAAFLTGAESAYRYLQSAWDRGDLAAIRGLTTDKVFAEIQDQLRAANGNNKTEVLQLKSELLEVSEVGSDWEAAVLFDATLREDNGPTEQVQEVWHFIRSKNSSQPKWFLDGIQQVTE